MFIDYFHFFKKIHSIHGIKTPHMEDHSTSNSVWIVAPIRENPKLFIDNQFI